MIQRRMNWLLFLIVCLPFKLAAYEPPTGIPDPAWGGFHPIDAVAPAHPPGWPSTEVSNFYYIDNQHAASTDSGNVFGYPEKPRKTIPEGDVYAAGAYVEIHNGPYTGGGQIIFTANGTEADPVWFRGPSTTEMPIIRGETIVKGSYIVMEHLRYDTDKRMLGLRVHNGSNLHHATIRNSKFTGSGTDVGFASGINISGSAGNRFTDIVVYNNDISELGDDSISANENDYHGVTPSIDLDRVWILNNRIFNLGGDSVQVGVANIPNDTQRPSGIYIGANEFYHNHENAVDVKEADKVIVSQNVMHDFYQSNTGATGSIVVIHNTAKDVFVINNEIYDGNFGIINTAGKNNWYIGNIIHDIVHAQSPWNPESLFADGVAIHFRGDSSGGALNNTIYNYDIGVQISSGSLNYTLLNNVLFNRTEPAGVDVNVAGGVQAITTISSNAFFNPGSERIGWSGVKTVSEWQVIDNQCLDCPVSDPGVDTTDGLLTKHRSDFSSPLFNAGAGIQSVQDNFFAIFGIVLDKDVFGNPRKTSTSIDIGAFEYPEPTSVSNPPGVTNIVVNN